jgi:hypothetical protein
MADDDDVVQPSGLDVGDDRFHPVGDGQRPEIPRPRSPTGQVDGQHVEIRCQPPDFVDGEVPAVRSMDGPVH